MLDEIVYRNASKFAIFLEYENTAYTVIKSKVAQIEKRNKLFGFSYSKNMANFEAFR